MRPGIRLVGAVAVAMSTLLAACGSAPVTPSRPATPSEGTVLSVLKGFAGTMSEQAARRLAADPAVKHVEQNQVASAGVVTRQPAPSSGSAAPSTGDCG